MQRGYFYVAAGDEHTDDVGRSISAVILANNDDGTATVAIKPTFADWQIRYGCPVFTEGARPLSSFVVRGEGGAS